jgi:hypothetical protein
VQRVDFEADGSLRDIYVLDASLEDWRPVLGLLEQGPYEARLVRTGSQGMAQPLPRDPGSLFTGEQQYLLRFTVGGVQLACHFFTPDEVEFDFLPNGVSEASVRELLRFMARVGDLTGKRVVMTPENVREHPIYAYDPATQRMSWVEPQAL